MAGKSPSLPKENVPSVCDHCGKSEDRLRRCSRCKVVAYCSTECQRHDWKRRHGIDCRKSPSSNQESDGVGAASPMEPQQLQATKQDEWNLETQQHGTTMCLHGNKQIVCGLKVPDKTHCPIVVYDMKKGRKETTLCPIEEDRGVCGMSSITVGGESFILVSMITNEEVCQEYQLWAYPRVRSKPVYTFTIDCMSTAHTFIDNKLLVVDGLQTAIHEIDAGSIPFRLTGTIIRTDLRGGFTILKLCAFKSGGAKRLLLTCKDMTDRINAGKYKTIATKHFIPPRDLEGSSIKCYDYGGQLLWKFAEHWLDGKSIHPVAISADDAGHVFVSDWFHNRVVVINHDGSSVQSARTLIITPGKNNQCGMAAGN